MSRQTTDDDVVYLTRRINRACTGIIRAQTAGSGPPSSQGQSVFQVLVSLLKTPILSETREVADEISDYYLTVYRYMVGRGSPKGIEAEWMLIVDLFRSIGDAYADLADQTRSPVDNPDRPKVLRHDLPGDEQLRLIAEIVDADLVAEANNAATAVLNLLAGESDTNPLSQADLELLRMMISGRTVEEIASETDVSSRTIHRRLQAIWDQVGAASRTEGIAVVSARGWLD